MEAFQNFGKNVGATFTTTFTPFAARTGQFVKEQLGQADDKIRLTEADLYLKWAGDTAEKTQLPADYRELEARVDALQKVHQRLLSVTSQYGNEPYDYPPNLRESITDLSRNVTEKIQLLSNAQTPQEAQHALVSPSQTPTEPKTFAHALSRASAASSHLLPASDPLASALEKYATASRSIGQARLAQDHIIVSQFNKPYSTNLNIAFKNTRAARTEVENCRLLLDAAKSKAKARENQATSPTGGPMNFLGVAKKDPAAEAAADEELRQEIEMLEDGFITAMEKAVESMNNLLNTPEPLQGLSALINAQLEYHQAATDALQDVAEVVLGLQREQEASYRQSRERAT